MKKISLIRDPRKSVLEYYALFKSYKITYVTGKPGTQSPLETKYSDHVRVIEVPFVKPVIIDPTDLIGHPYNLAWRYFKNCEDYIKESDIVGLQDTYYPYSYNALTYAKKYNKPIFTEIWCNTPHHITSLVPPYSWITKQIIQNTDLFILRNNKAYEFTDSLKIPRDKTQMIYMGINTEKFSVRKSNNPNDITILYVGRLITSKGIINLIEAFENCLKKHSNIKLICAGSGPLEEYITKKARDIPVIFQGYTDYGDLPSLYRQADIFCSPSLETKAGNQLLWSEYFSYTLMEAQATGLPILATETGGIPEELHNDNMLVPPNESKRLTSALLQLIENESLRIKIGNKNREYALKNFNAAIQAQKLERTLNSYFKN